MAVPWITVWNPVLWNPHCYLIIGLSGNGDKLKLDTIYVSMHDSFIIEQGGREDGRMLAVVGALPGTEALGDGFLIAEAVSELPPGTKAEDCPESFHAENCV